MCDRVRLNVLKMMCDIKKTTDARSLTNVISIGRLAYKEFKNIEPLYTLSINVPVMKSTPNVPAILSVTLGHVTSLASSSVTNFPSVKNDR